MTKIAHVLAAVNAVIGFCVLMGWLDLSTDEVAALMGALGVVGASVGAFFDPRIPWFGASPSE